MRKALFYFIIVCWWVLCFDSCDGLREAAADWTGAPSPHDGQHLVVVKPTDFRPDGGAKLAPVVEKTAVFGNAITLDRPLTSPLKVQHAGTYDIWVRIASGDRQTINFAYELLSAAPGKSASVLKGNISSSTIDVKGDAKLGGPAGQTAFAKSAQQSGAIGKLDQIGGEKKGAGSKSAGLEDDLLADIAKQKGEKPATNWAHFTRIEQVQPLRPAYWWRLGKVELAAGEYRLQIIPTAVGPRLKPLQLETAFLTTSSEIQYPFRGDIEAPSASYIRFRLADAPVAGLTIGATLKLHYDPFSTGHVWLNPENMSVTKSEPHTKSGFTRWYRLQDIERAPAFSRGEAHLLLDVNGAKSATSSGSTQFAIYPHEDFVLREIGWSEPDGLLISMNMNFEANLHLLRTFRDHAREHYEYALTATHDRLFPLTRGELYFGNAWGNATSSAADYMVKTLRLLGFNCVGDQSDPVANRERYGWSSHAGHYWPPSYMPYNEAESRKKYDEHYRDYFGKLTPKQRDFYQGVSIFQIADEPGEIARNEMTSPLWRFTSDDLGEKYEDATGGSILATNRSDYQDYVLEGKIEAAGRWVGFRVATDRPDDPTRYADWRLGQVSVSREINVASSRKGLSTPGEAAFTRPGATVGAKPVPFKIVYSGTAAELFINGKRVQQHAKLPPSGGFAIVGGAKSVRDLLLRPARAEERIVTDAPDSSLATSKVENPLDAESFLKDGDVKKIVAKPLRQAISSEWTVAGGMPEAHRGFREWAKSHGLKPELFGQKTWDDVRMLTVPSLVTNEDEAKLFYWSRRYSGFLTPHMFGLSAEAIQRHAPNKDMRGFVALSGHSLYFPSETPLDMFQLASDTPMMIPGISDWMSYGGWRWDSHQAVAYSISMFNAGARRHGQAPSTFPMMHCVGPSDIRAYTMLANNVRYISFYNFGPSYAATEGYWSESAGSYRAVHNMANRAAQVDDVLASSYARPSRVALLYSMSNEYWNAQASFADKRATFLALSHEYYQPELVTEDQIAGGDLQHYDALYVLDPLISDAAQQKIGDWVKSGGLLWTCADAGRFNEYHEPRDLLASLIGLEREFSAEHDAVMYHLRRKPGEKKKAIPVQAVVKARMGSANFRQHTVSVSGLPVSIRFDEASTNVRAEYLTNGTSPPGDLPSAAWLEKNVEKGRVVYIGHRVGLTYSSHAVRPGGYADIWSSAARPLLAEPLLDKKVVRELELSEPTVMAAPLSSNKGTVIVLYNMRPQTLKPLRLSLRDPAKPTSVQCFVQDRLTNVPFEFRDGRVEITLPELLREQLVVVRREPAPADTRVQAMIARTSDQLSSKDPRTLAAAAWFAGMLTEAPVETQNEFSNRLRELLKHERWEVRRAAVESLGKLRAGSVDLIALLAKEKDAHVAGDALVALARMQDARTIPLAEDFITHPNAVTKQLAVRAVIAVYHPNAVSTFLSSANTKTSLNIAEKAITDPDRRVRAEGIRLLSLLDAEQLVKRTVAAYREENPERGLWSEALASRDAAYSLWIQSAEDAPRSLVLSLSTQRRDERLASLLEKHLQDVTAAEIPSLVSATIRQTSEPLTRAIWAQRTTLPTGINGLLPLMLECTFDRQFGNSLTDWETWLSK